MYLTPRWGESAGSISVAYHLLFNGGKTEGLFHGAIMQGGSPLSVGDISEGQKTYDFIVWSTGCLIFLDTLECLRHVPLDRLQAVVDRVPGFFDRTVSITVCINKMFVDSETVGRTPV